MCFANQEVILGSLDTPEECEESTIPERAETSGIREIQEIIEMVGR